ncbi:MAG: type I DNA topoisomerase [Epulopiscium sp.]|nr:type I DNA topoisomerase [Candidatus Epulonipiscium sp.]
MAKYLVIVESPAKAKTIKKFLGSSYKVEASNGHVRDLPKSQLGIDMEKDFEPKYITIRGKGELLAKLRKEAKKADKVFLATDPDREGEAISWHLCTALKLDEKTTSRITFNEITKNAVRKSIKEARHIDMDLVDAQQARRTLDRIVGYQISPLLWKKVRKGLSAGRVQSVTLRLICDREEEIQNFIPEEYWTIDGHFFAKESKVKIESKFYGSKKEKINITSSEQAEKILQDLEKEKFHIADIRKGERIRNTLPPFITSTLQQEASKQLGFSTQKSMRIAQQLYEGVDVAGFGSVGLITYIRTDSIRISEDAEKEVKTYISEQFGKQFINTDPPKDRKKGKMQDAHEAIRPTSLIHEPAKIKGSLSRDQYRLYDLIWKRFVASRMAPAKYETHSVQIHGGEYRFNASGSTLVFEGFLAVLDQKEEKEPAHDLGKLKKDQKVDPISITGNQHFTQPPARYTEAALVKTLEENGVGRPSTYAPTITTILQRGYVTKEEKNLYPTELGEIVNDIMVNYFKDIVDVDFTAQLEERLDRVEEGDLPWKTVLREFHPAFQEALEVAEKEIGEIQIEDEVTDILCEKCGLNMVVKFGRYGKFLACPGFPECRNAKPLYEEIDAPCPTCGGKVFIKKTKKGRTFYGCEHNPECGFMSWNLPTNKKCPKCGDILVEKGRRNKKIACNNTKCDYVEDTAIEK